MSKAPDPRCALWTPPEFGDAGAEEIPGAMGGSRLFEQPQYRAEVDAFLEFLAPEGPVGVEIGFDKGRRLCSLAVQDPKMRWVGMEVREAQVLSLAERAPSNLLPWRVDARIAFRRLVPEGRLQRVDILFPTPWWDERKRAKRYLVTPPFVQDLRRSLAPDGVIYIATDIEKSFEWMASLFADWRVAPLPEPAPSPSRRESSCARDGLPIWRGAWTSAERR